MSWTETVGNCPEAIGGHQTDGKGKCCFCGARVSSPATKYNHRSQETTRYSTQDPRWIDGPDEADYLDGR